MKYKAIMIDIDATLLNSQGKITENTKASIKKIADLGVEIVLCSGRVFTNTLIIADQLDVCNYLITTNGALIYSNHLKKIVSNNTMNYCDIVDINDFVTDDMVAIYNSGTATYFNRVHKIVGTVIDIRDREFFMKNPIEEIVVCTDTEEEIRALESFLNEKPNVVIQTINKSFYYDKEGKKIEYYYADINGLGTSKGIAVEKLAGILNINLDEIVIIGDGGNDLSMFVLDGPLKVAMGNAREVIKENADIITLTNDEDGVSHIIEQLINGKGQM